MVSGDINRKVSVILAADVVGYSKHMEENENETVKALDAVKLFKKSFKKTRRKFIQYRWGLFFN